jgi:hypothetical protein
MNPAASKTEAICCGECTKMRKGFLLSQKKKFKAANPARK